MTATAKITNPAQESSRAGNGDAIEKIAIERGEKTQISLKALFISDSNVRKTRNAESIPELAATILAQGLLSSLIVIKEKAKGIKGKTHGVVAGGRRLMALNWLVEQGHIAADASIPCVVIAVADAIAVSLTENTQQETMHAADQLGAFKEMVLQGFTAGQIAAQFGVTELTVVRRLALGSLAPVFLDLFRADKIEQQQLMALALCPSHERQIEVWESLPSYSRSPYQIRQLLTQEETKASESVARFVGVDSYIEAGGAVRSDLFEDNQYLQDTPLLMKLAADKLAAKAEQLKSEDWKWVDVALEFSYADRSRFGKLTPASADPTAEQAAVIDSLLARIAHAEQRVGVLEDIEAYDDEADDYGERNDEQEAEYQRVSSEIEAFNSELEGLRRELLLWTPEQKAVAGVMVALDDGVIKIYPGMVRPEDRKEAASEEGSEYEPAKKERAEFSASLCQNLTAHRTAAVAAALTQNPQTALVALLHTMITNDRERWVESPVKVSFSNHMGDTARNAAEFGDTQAASIIEQADALLGDHLPGDGAALFACLQGMESSQLLEILAVFVARSYTVASPEAKRKVRGYDLAQGIESALQVNMADWWKPTAATYLAQVPKAKMQEAITEACGAEEAKSIEKMKKTEAVAATAALLDGKGWLPPTLRAY